MVPTFVSSAFAVYFVYALSVLLFAFTLVQMSAMQPNHTLGISLAFFRLRLLSNYVQLHAVALTYLNKRVVMVGPLLHPYPVFRCADNHRD